MEHKVARTQSTGLNIYCKIEICVYLNLVFFIFIFASFIFRFI